MVDFVTIFVNLFLVSIILFVYRQYDKRSRALDKIKKFVDIAKGNLEDFIEDKTQEINNLAVDMEAYQRSSIEIIKKIDEVQKKIESKRADFGEVEKKISYHDSMLKDLDDMALKVQDNIQRLQVDGKIVDKLSKTLKGFNNQIDLVESNLSSVLEKFNKTNRDNLESIKIDSWEKFDNDIKLLVQRIDDLTKELDSYERDLSKIEDRRQSLLVKGNDKLNSEFEEFLGKIESNVDKYNKSIESSFGLYEDKYKLMEESIALIMENAKTKIEEKEDFILNRLDEELQAKFNEVFSYIDDRSIKIQDKLEDKLSLVENEISSIGSSFKDSAYSRLNLLEETIRLEIGKYEEQVANIFDKFRSQIELNIKNIYVEYEDRINQVDKDVRKRVDLSLLDVNSKMDSIESSAKSLIRSIEADSNEIYVAFKETFKKEVEIFSENFKDRVQSFEVQLETQLSNVDLDIQGKLSKLNDEAIFNVKEVEDKLSNNYLYLNDSVNSKYTALLESLDSKSHSLEIQIEDKYKHISDKLIKDIDEFSLTYDSKFNQLYQESSEHYQEFLHLNKKLANEIALLKNIFVEDCETLRKDFDISLTNTKEKISNSILEFRNHYDNKIDNFICQIEESKFQYSQWQSGMNANLKEIESHLNKTNEDFLNLIENQKDKGRELSENVFNELSEHIQKKAMDMHCNWKDELIALNKSLIDIKISSEELLSSVSSKVENLDRDVNDRFEYVLMKTSDFENSILKKYQELKDMSYLKGDETFSKIKEFIDNQAEIIHSKGVFLLEDLNQKFDTKNSFVISKIEELDYKFKRFRVEAEDDLNNLKSDFARFVSEKFQTLSDIKLDNQNQIDDFLNKVSQEVLNRKDLINDEVDNKLGEWQNRLNETTIKVDNLLSSSKSDLNLMDSEIAAKINELKLSTEGLSSYYLEKIDEFKHQGEVYYSELLKDITNRFERDSRELEEDLSRKFALILNNSEEFVKEIDSLLQDKRADVASFQANIDITFDFLNAKFTDIKKEINEKYNEVISNYREYSESVAFKLEDEIMYEIDSVNRRLSERIDSLSKHIEENLQRVRESFDTSQYQVEKFELKIKDITDSEESKISDFLREIEQHYKYRRDEAINYRQMIDNDIIQVKERFGAIVNDIKDNIEAKVEFLNDLYRERLKLVESNFDEKYSTFLVEIEGSISKVRDEIYEMLTKNDENLRIKISEIDQNFNIVEQRANDVIELERELVLKIENNYDSINFQLEEIKSNFEKDIKDHFKSCMEEANNSVFNDISKYEIEIQKKIESLKSIEYVFKSMEKDLSEKINNLGDVLVNDIDLKYGEFESKCDEKRILIENKILNKIENLDNLALSQYDELEKKYSDIRSEVEKRLNSYIDSLNDELKYSNDSIVIKLESQFENLKTLELNLNNVERDIIRLKEESYQNFSSHIKRLEEDFFSDLKIREEKLNSSLEDFVILSNDRIKNLKNDLESNLEDKATLIKSFNVELEQKMNHVKENFYLDFDKEFFNRKKDIESKIALIETKVVDRMDEFINFVNNQQSTFDSWFLNVKNDVKIWQERSYKTMEERVNIAELGIRSVENDINNIKNNLEDLKGNIEIQSEEIFGNLYSRSEKVENLVSHHLKNVEDNFNRKVLDLENFMDLKVETVDGKINKIIEDISGQVEVKILSHQKDLEDKIFDTNQKFENEFVELYSKLEKTKQGIVSRIFSDKENFESQVELMHKKISEFYEKLDLYRKGSEMSIEDEYNAFSKSIREEYFLFESEIKKNLKYSTEKIELINSNLKNQVSDIEIEIKQICETILKKIDVDIMRLESKISNYDIEINKFVENVKGNFIEYKDDLKKELENRYHNINSQIEDLRKLEIEFEQNQVIFSEVYLLKDNLNALWEALSEEIDLAKKYKNNFEDFNREFNSTQEELLGIIETFNELKLQKESIRGIKNDFERFLEFFASFNDRYKSLTESYDEIQLYKAKIKKIGENQKTILDNYERISNKESILNSTIESVDKNFDLINEIEKKVEFLNKESDKFQSSLKEMENSFANLLINKNLSEEVFNNAQNLREMLKDIESKLENTFGIREKVAKSATRLENLNIAAEERIKTLGILVKTESKYKDNVGLNNETVRDSVIKLMRQGWSAEEISRATKLSVGEVELILELGVSSKSD